jgi:hypothetical protein
MLSVTDDLAAAPDDPAAVCRLIASFLESWNVMPTGSGIRAAEDEVGVAEQRLGFALPTALRWLFTHVGTDNAVVGHQDPLVQPQHLEVDDQGLVVYRVENQNCAQWGIRVGDIAQPDPPVLWKDLQNDEDWRPYQERLSVELLETTFNEAMLLPGADLLQTELASGVPAELERLPRLAIPTHVFWAMPDGPPVTWYGVRDCLIRNDGDTWLWAFGRTSEDAQRATEMIPGEWMSLQE